MADINPTSFKNGVPKGERNAFFGIEEQIMAAPGDTIVAVVTYEVAKIVHEEIEDVKYPVVEIKHIEILGDEKAKAAAVKLRDAAYKARTGQNALDLGGDF
ncbi:hypothetical protein [Microbacterium sp.]|uniref:hypothetical protein n=1 Tax=Microbacterium sp. TaxID=51671 RepID=UPI0039E38653